MFTTFQFKIRQYAFWVWDYLKGGSIKNHYDGISQYFTSNNEIERENINTNHLKSLLTHAIESTPYYNKIVEKSSSLDSFPVINKSIIKEGFEDFKSNRFNDKQYIPVITSGSTGTPFKVYQDKNKKDRNYADTLFFSKMVGYELGYRVLYLKIWVKERMQSDWKFRIQNIFPIDVIKLTDDKLKKIILDIERNKNMYHSVTAYVSALEEFIKYCTKFGVDKMPGKFSCVITISEALSIETKAKLKSLFDCPVYSRYSNLENGIIAQQQLTHSDDFLINTASYLVEIFDIDNDNLLEDGKLGRIVVTDYFNYSMPMIRYDTGDLGILKKTKEGLQYLTKIEGRKLDVLLDTDGNVVSSYIMYKNMWQYTEILQYQLIQTEQKSYEFIINCPNGFKQEEKLVAEFKAFLGEDAIFKVHYVDDIPLLNSGKRRKTVNLYLQSKNKTKP